MESLLLTACGFKGRIEDLLVDNYYADKLGTDRK
jgi:hypothetical protein